MVNRFVPSNHSLHEGTSSESDVVAASQFVLMLGTSPSARGGITSVVTTLREGGLFDQARVHYVTTHVESGGLAKLVQFARAVANTFRALCSKRVALVHAHVSSKASFWRKASLLAMARSFHVPTIFHLHSGAFDEFATKGGRFRRWCVRQTLRRSDVVIVLSNRWRQWVQDFAPGSTVRVVANAVNVPHAVPRRSPEGDAARGGRVLFLGMICDGKGTFDLLQAWVQFSEKVKGWRLVIGGNGEVDRFLVEAQTLGVRSDVDYLGWVSGPAKFQELSAADIFVLPSYKEGMPVSILEAMAYGASVIATPVGGVPDMLEADVHGLVVSPGDVAALSRALVQLASSAALRLRLATAAHAHVSKHYATDKVIEQLCAIYREVSNVRRS
jgi:glycosyltransferase involved in cell wall biosynthesis